MPGWLWQPLLPLTASAPEAETRALHFVRLPFRPLGPNPYLRHYPQDLDAPPPPVEPSTLAPYLVRVPFRPFGRNPYVRHQSIEGPAQLDDASSGHLVVPTWDGFRLARASRYYYRGWQHLSAPEEPSTFAAHFVRLPFRPLARSRYLSHYAQDTDAPPVVITFQAGWARNVNTVFNANRTGRGVIA